MGLSRDDLAALLDAFEQSDWTEMVLAIDGTVVELATTGRAPERRRDGAAAHPPATLAADAAPAPISEPAPPQASSIAAAQGPAPGHGLHEVRAPSVGIFYRAPDPAAAPFVEVGQHVRTDDIVCIVEVMKLMNHVKAGVDGIVRSSHVENGTMIEHGDLLFTIEPDQ